MSYASLLINLATVERYVAGAADAYGNPAEAWANHLVDEPCRLSDAKGRQRMDGTEVVQVDELLFMNDVDVIEHDRVTVDGTLYEILFVDELEDSTVGHHLELDLVLVR